MSDKVQRHTYIDPEVDRAIDEQMPALGYKAGRGNSGWGKSAFIADAILLKLGIRDPRFKRLYRARMEQLKMRQEAEG